LYADDSGSDLFLASLDHCEENLVRRQYLMLTPQEQETPGTALGSRRPSRDMSPYEEPDYGSSSYAVRGILFALLRWPHWLTALEGIRLN